MPLWESVISDHPEMAEAMAALANFVSTMHDETITFEGALAPTSVIDRVVDDETAPAGIYGYGVWSEQRGRIAPAVFTQPGLAPPLGAPIHTTPTGVLMRFMQIEVPGNVLAVSFSPTAIPKNTLRAHQ